MLQRRLSLICGVIAVISGIFGSPFLFFTPIVPYETKKVNRDGKGFLVLKKQLRKNAPKPFTNAKKYVILTYCYILTFCYTNKICMSPI